MASTTTNVPNRSSPPPHNQSDERVARGVVAGHRGRLDWLLRVPEFERLIETAVKRLELPGRRQGIGHAAAVRALPLEHKYDVLRWVLPRFRSHLRAPSAQAICRTCAIERFDQRDLDEYLSMRQWASLRERLESRLALEHRRYKRAQQLLFTQYRHLVDLTVAKIAFQPAHQADCRQEGAMGLLHALDRVDESTVDLAAYCSAWIRRSVRNYLMRQRLPVQAPVNLISKAAMVRSGRRNADETQRSDDEPGLRLRALLLQCLDHPAVTLDEPLEPGGACVRERVADESAESPAEAAARQDTRAVLREKLGSLTGKQRDVVIRRFGFDGLPGCSVTEIAREVGISHQQVSMRERRALRRLESELAPLVRELAGTMR